MIEIKVKLDEQEAEDIIDGLASRRANLEDIKDVWNKAEREIKVIDKLLAQLIEEEKNE